VKRLLAVLVAFGAVAAATLVAVQRCHDRDLFVPGPDATAESAYRRRGARDVKASTRFRTGKEALVDVRFRSERGSESVEVRLVWDGQEWKVVQSAFP
jgi:hypothetical protein